MIRREVEVEVEVEDRCFLLLARNVDLRFSLRLLMGLR